MEEAVRAGLVDSVAITSDFGNEEIEETKEEEKYQRKMTQPKQSEYSVVR